MNANDPLPSRPDVPLSGVPASSVPLLATVLAVGFAVAYGAVLGYELTVPDPRSAAVFVLTFGAVGAGVALVARDVPVAAATGLLGLVVFPPLLTWFAGTPSGLVPVVRLLVAGGAALGLFLVVAGSEALLRAPESVRSALASRDTVVGSLLGVALTVPAFLAWTVPVSGYGSLMVRLLHGLVIATRGGLLAAAVLVVVLFLTRRRAVAPALLVASAFLTAATGAGTGDHVWSATPALLAELGISLLVLAVAVGMLELAARALLAGVRSERTAAPDR